MGNFPWLRAATAADAKMLQHTTVEHYNFHFCLTNLWQGVHARKKRMAMRERKRRPQEK